ncbi:MAG TPA: TonB-dependent receptor, partial [Pontibacter sp.]
FTDWLTVMYGLRYSFYAVYGPADVYSYQPGEPKKERTITDTLNYSRGDVIETYHGAEPRISASMRIGQNSAVKVGYNRSRQYLHLISNTTTVSPTDTWKTSNTYIKPQLGDQVTVGYFRNLRKNQFEAGIEGYYKRIQNIPDYKNGAVLYLNKTLEADLLAGKGRAYGIETSVSKVSGRLTGFVNYTYSRTELSVAGPTEEETINNGKYYPASYDKPHTLNLVSSYELNKRLVASINFTYSTGRPITAPVSHYVIGDYVVPNYGERNAYRIPDYHRLDISLAILPNKDRNKRWEGTWNIAVYNLYGRKNPYSVFFKQVYGAPPRAYQLAVVGVPLPSISYDFKFR